MANTEENAKAVLRRPYSRLVVSDEDGGFSAQILEFPGCFAAGETASEACKNLEEVAVSWILATLDQGLDLPEPRGDQQASGRFALRMPRSLHQRATHCAEIDGVSLNQFIVMAIAESVGAAQSKPPLQKVEEPSSVRSGPEV